jgi:hypothetical protein
VVLEFFPTVRKIIAARDGGVWKSPERSASLTDVSGQAEARQP